MQRVEHGDHIPDQGPIVVSGGRKARSSESPARDADHPIGIAKLRGETVEDVSGVAVSGEKYQRLTAPSPIEHLQGDARLHGDPPHAVR
jgi:hypothetical protein